MKKITLSLAAAAFASVGFADTTVFNAMPSGTYFTGTSITNNLSGELFNTTNSAAAPISGFDLDFDTIGTAGSSSVFTDLQLQVSFFTAGQTTWSGSGNEFSGTEATYTLNIGAISLPNGYYWDLAGLYGGTEIALPSGGFAVASNYVGVQFCWLNVVNGVAAATTSLQTASQISAAPTVGLNGCIYTGNGASMTFAASGATSSATSLTQAQYIYTGAANNNLAAQLFVTPEPASMAFLGLGIVGLVARRRYRK